MRLRIPRESLLVFSTPSTLYAILGGLVSVLASAVVGGAAHALSGWVGASDGGWQGWGVGMGWGGRGRGWVGECALQREREEGGQVELISRRFRGLKLSVASICHRWKSDLMF